jgi:nucleoside-diphosphate-sugar epimerase
MKILFIGGTGIISSASARLCLDKGYDLYLFNRGKSFRPVPEGAHVISGDYFNRTETNAILRDNKFDVVVDWVAFEKEHVEFDIQQFRGKTDQYVFISSASAYETPPSKLPVTEKTPLDNPFWEYSRNKIACEQHLTNTWKSEQFPVTIVRPSHTYDHTILPFRGGYTFIDRLKKGKKIIVHGDGTSIWTMTHTNDFAKGFVGLLGNPKSIGEAFHITSDELLTWNQMANMIGEAAGLKPDILHVPSEIIARFDAELGYSLLGDKSHSMIFDNSKIQKYVPAFKATIPFSEGVKQVLEWFENNPDQQNIDTHLDRIFDSISSKYSIS